MKKMKRQIINSIFSNRILLIFVFLLLLAFNTGDSKSEYVIPIRAASVYTDDIDLDGDRDVIVGHLTSIGDTNPSISLLKNIGEGYFEIFDTSQSFLGYQYDIFSTKINNDEYPDIVTRYYQTDNNKSSSFIRVIYMNENGIGNHLDFNIMNNEFSFRNIISSLYFELAYSFRLLFSAVTAALYCFIS